MSDQQSFPGTTAPIRQREGRIGLRTLILIRWIAVAGQTATILIVHLGFGFKLPVVACLFVVALTALSNLMLSVRMPVRARLGNVGATLLLGFDMLQLGMLLYLTGGLENPFAILILAPVTVAATILARGPTLALTILAMVLVTLLLEKMIQQCNVALKEQVPMVKNTRGKVNNGLTKKDQSNQKLLQFL